MLKPDAKLAIYMEGALGQINGKMGDGVLRYSPNAVVAVIDSAKKGGDIQAYVNCDRRCPIVGSLEEAKALGADVLILGIAPSGGIIPEKWYPEIDRAIDLGFSLVNGLHTHLAHRYPHIKAPQWVWDIRHEPANVTIATGKARHLNNKRVLFVGSDMAVGKMTAALELYRAALQADVNAAFIATGQIGITISGQGIALDAIRLDYACGAVEQAVMDAQSADMIIIEGQGSLAHPGSTANLPLLRGSCPTHLVFCHRAGQTQLATVADVTIPPILDLIKLYEDLACACGTFIRPQTIGICLNTGHLDAKAAEIAVRELEEQTGLVTVDVVRQGAGRLLSVFNSVVI